MSMHNPITSGIIHGVASSPPRRHVSIQCMGSPLGRTISMVLDPAVPIVTSQPTAVTHSLDGSDLLTFRLHLLGITSGVTGGSSGCDQCCHEWPNGCGWIFTINFKGDYSNNRENMGKQWLHQGYLGVQGFAPKPHKQQDCWLGLLPWMWQNTVLRMCLSHS